MGLARPSLIDLDGGHHPMHNEECTIQHALLSVRGRTGIRAQFYHQTSGRIHFASKAKSLCADPCLPRRLKRQSLAERFTCWSPEDSVSPASGRIILHRRMGAVCSENRPPIYSAARPAGSTPSGSSIIKKIWKKSSSGK